MHTELAPINETTIAKAAKLLLQNEVVGMPTETVYGLAANAFSDVAVEKIFAAKGRPQDNPLIVHIADMDDLSGVVAQLPKEAQRLAEVFWPGPLTMILPKGEQVADSVSAGLASVGVRMPAHKGARWLIREAGVPLAAPSANLSGRPSPTTAQHVMDDLSGKIHLILDGGAAPVGVESTVLSLLEEPIILRPGFVSAEAVAEVLGRPVALSYTATEPLVKGERPESPGTKYRHYAPRANLVLVKGDRERFARFLQTHQDNGVWAFCFEEDKDGLPVPFVVYGKAGDEASQSAGLFAALRKLDEVGAKQVYARFEYSEGKGLAVYNRLLRAAAFQVVEA